MQISTRKADYLIDAITLKNLLNKYLSAIFSDEKIVKVWFIFIKEDILTLDTRSSLGKLNSTTNSNLTT